MITFTTILLIAIVGLAAVGFGGMGFLTGLKYNDSFLPVIAVMSLAVLASVFQIIISRDYGMSVVLGSWVLGILAGRLARASSQS